MHDDFRLSVDKVDYSPMVAEAPEGKKQTCLNVDKLNQYLMQNDSELLRGITFVFLPREDSVPHTSPKSR